MNPIYEINIGTPISNYDSPTQISQIKSQTNVNQKLVFTYPIFVTDKLKSVQNDIRDFFTISCINHIRESNIINIISSATHINSNKSYTQDIINPAERLANSLGKLTHIPHATNSFQSFEINQKKFELQEKINQYRMFISNQIRHDPKYNKLRPFISTISSNELIDLPLIVSTEDPKELNTKALYYLLLGALLTGKKLTSGVSFDDILPLLRRLPESEIIRLLSPEDAQQSKAFLDKQEEIITKDNDLFIKTVLSQSNSKFYEDELSRTAKYIKQKIDISSNTIYMNNNQISLNKVLDDTSVLRNNLVNKSVTLFSSFISDDIVQLLTSITHAVTVETDMDLSKKINIFTNSIGSKTNIVYNAMLYNFIESFHTKVNEDGIFKDNSEATLNKSKLVCEVIEKLAVNNILQEIQGLFFSITNTDIAKFTERFVLVSNKLQALTNSLEYNLFSLARKDDTSIGGISSKSGTANVNKGLESILKDFRQDIEESIWKYFFDKSDGGAIVDSGFTSNVGPQNKPSFINPSDRFKYLLSGKGNISQYIKTCSNSLANICYFMALFCFQSYYCEYLKEVHIKVTLQKKDALDFPNYIMTIPKWMIDSLIGAMELKNILNANRDKNTSNVDTKYNISESVIFRYMQTFQEKLGIPNLIIVDDKQKEFYYNFMWMSGNPTKLKMDSIPNYINNQYDIEPGF